VYRRAPLLREGGFCAELDAFCDGYASQLLALRHGACFSPEVLAAWRLMEGGMATSQTTSGERTAQVVAAAQRRMAEAGVFPAGYAERWRGRFLFGARRYALSLQRRRAMARGVVPGLAGAAREALLTAWLFARLRPRDAWPVMRRRLQAAS
jgi:hypothetical protein